MYNQLPIFSEIDRQFAQFISQRAGELSAQELETLEDICLVLSYYANQQHSVLPLRDILIEYRNEDGHIVSHNIDFELDEQALKIYSQVMGQGDEIKPLIVDLENQLIYLNKYYRAEATVARFISKLADQTQELDSQLTQKLNEVFPNQIAEKINWQKVAAFMALRSRFCVISGGPGTGKTTTVGKILALLLEQNPETRIDLLAPTGKAADRLGESIRNFISSQSDEKAFSAATLAKIPVQAQTIHRYLGFAPGGGFKHNDKFKTPSDILLIDESSMVPLTLFRSVIQALQSHCRVILLGDKDQLAAVETGNVLGDLTAGGQINSFSPRFAKELKELSPELILNEDQSMGSLQDIMLKLEHSFRFDSSSGIGQLARDINEQPVPHPLEDTQYFKAYDDIAHQALPAKAEELFSGAIRQCFTEYKKSLNSPEEALKALNKFRILCASRNGSFGASKLNQHISQIIFSQSDESLYTGRAIMITRNDYNIKLYNGDIGIILPDDSGLPKAWFPGPDNSLRSFPPSMLPDYQSAFAMTIHKSQGSEYQNVHLILPDQADRLLSKELIYTGITRAKSSIVIYASRKTLLSTCKRQTDRLSGLKLRLAQKT